MPSNSPGNAVDIVVCLVPNICVGHSALPGMPATKDARRTVWTPTAIMVPTDAHDVGKNKRFGLHDHRSAHVQNRHDAWLDGLLTRPGERAKADAPVTLSGGNCIHDNTGMHADGRRLLMECRCMHVGGPCKYVALAHDATTVHAYIVDLRSRNRSDPSTREACSRPIIARRHRSP
jgi:hypothetical protein